MSKNKTFVGICIVGVVLTAVFLFTNVFDLTKPSIDQSVVTAKNAISQVDGEDVVSGAELVSSKITNETSKIKLENPFP
ncbi:MAG: hypothetical protein ACE5R7_05210 [Nitrosarchaeum sp.]